MSLFKRSRYTNVLDLRSASGTCRMQCTTMLPKIGLQPLTLKQQIESQTSRLEIGAHDQLAFGISGHLGAYDGAISRRQQTRLRCSPGTKGTSASRSRVPCMNVRGTSSGIAADFGCGVLNAGRISHVYFERSWTLHSEHDATERRAVRCKCRIYKRHDEAQREQGAKEGPYVHSPSKQVVREQRWAGTRLRRSLPLMRNEA